MKAQTSVLVALIALCGSSPAEAGGAITPKAFVARSMRRAFPHTTAFLARPGAIKGLFRPVAQLLRESGVDHQQLERLEALAGGTKRALIAALKTPRSRLRTTLHGALSGLRALRRSKLTAAVAESVAAYREMIADPAAQWFREQVDALERDPIRQATLQIRFLERVRHDRELFSIVERGTLYGAEALALLKRPDLIGRGTRASMLTMGASEVDARRLANKVEAIIRPWLKVEAGQLERAEEELSKAARRGVRAAVEAVQPALDQDAETATLAAELAAHAPFKAAALDALLDSAEWKALSGELAKDSKIAAMIAAPLALWAVVSN